MEEQIRLAIKTEKDTTLMYEQFFMQVKYIGYFKKVIGIFGRL
jgi:hypothetical protein